MKRFVLLLHILLLLLVSLSGCWSRRELNELAIVVGMGIDKEDGKYVVTTQVVNPGEISVQQTSGTKAPVTVFQQKAETVFEAIRKMTTIAPRKLYFAHLRLVILGTEASEDGIAEIVDYLSRDHEFRTDFFLVVAKNTKAESVLEVLTSLDFIPANKLFDSLQTSEKVWASTMTITLDQLIADMVGEGVQPNLAGIEVLGDKESGNKVENIGQITRSALLQYSGMATFKNEKLVGWFNDQESKGLNYALGKVKSTIISVPCTEGGDKNVEIELIRTKSDITTELKNGSTKGIINFKAEANVASVGCKEVDLTKRESIPYLEEKTEEDIKASIEAAIKTSQEKFKGDYFGFGNALHRSHPHFWKKVKEDWDETFKDMPIDIKVDIKILQTGTIEESHF